VHTARTRSWDIAPLLLAGVVVGLLGPLLAGAGSGLAAVLSLGGLVLLLTALVRWTRRTRRREQARATSRDAVARPV
jgi:predicted lipid-binding transport protein (Tim44 family)